LKKTLVAVAFALTASAAFAGVTYVDLGTAAPPAAVGPISVQPFDLVPQQAIVNGTDVTSIPGSPIGGTLAINQAMDKVNIGAGWATWSHGYAGPVYTSLVAGTSGTTRTLTLPAGTTAFYLYVEPNAFATFNVECVTASGISSGPIPVAGSSGATGFGFYATNQDLLATITINVDAGANGFAIAEFGASDLFVGSPLMIPTLSTIGFAALALALGVAAFVMLRRRAA
jgi:hypothetical protein